MANENKETYLGIFGIVFVLAILFIFLSVDVVDASHQGVMVKFGEVKGTMNPGMKWTGLFVQVHQYDLRVRKANVEMLNEQSATDKDGQAVYGAVSVNYRLKPGVVEELYSNIGKDAVTSDILLIEPIIREGFKQATVKYEAIEILDKRQEVKELAKTNIENNFPSEYFEIEQIVVSNIDFSTQFKQAIEDKKTETQNKLKEQERLEVVILQQKQQLEVAKVEAEKLRLQKDQVTDQLNNQKMIEKWSGNLPEYLIITEGSQGMFLQLAQGKLDTGITGGISNNEE